MRQLSGLTLALVIALIVWPGFGFIVGSRDQQSPLRPVRAPMPARNSFWSNPPSELVIATSSNGTRSAAWASTYLDAPPPI